LLQFLKLEFYKILGVLDNHWKTIGVRTGNLILVSRLEQDFLTISTGKRKHDEISSGYFIPQRDGAADDELSTSMGEACQNVVGLLLSTSQKINRNKNKNVIRTCYYLQPLVVLAVHCGPKVDISSPQKSNFLSVCFAYSAS
jgi:hypothetical protein